MKKLMRYHFAGILSFAFVNIIGRFLYSLASEGMEYIWSWLLVLFSLAAPLPDISIRMHARKQSELFQPKNHSEKKALTIFWAMIPLEIFFSIVSSIIILVD